MESKKKNRMETDRERVFSHWLCNIEGIGRKGRRRLLREAGSAWDVFRMKESELASLLTPAQTENLLRSREKGDAEEDYRCLERRGIWYCPASDPLFPSRLAQVPDPPMGLYVTGRLPEEGRSCVAVVGARVCSEYGKYAARRFAGVLAASGVDIISGLARGIDGISQEAAMDNGGYTGAVMGCGVDICYPEENRRIYERIKAQGGILSEYPPGMKPLAGLFPQRNRIISGLSDLVLVIEARERSGTLITVDMALEQGKEVMAVPGRITDRLSSGCNRLIRQGAGMALTPEDVLEMLRPPSGREILFPAISGIGPREDARKKEGSGGETRDPFRQAVEETLEYLPMTAGQLCARLEEAGRKAGLPEVMHALLELTLEGKCAQDGGYFHRI